MKIIIKYFVCLIFCFQSCSVSSQYIKKSNELKLLSIVDTNLYPILDSVISFEQKCDYYNNSLFFTIQLRKVKGDSIYMLNIQSNNNMKTALNLEPDGYLYYAKHLFMIYGLNDKFIFSKTTDTKIFKYDEYIPDIKQDSIVTTINILDDSFTIWHYWHINKRFVFQDKVGSCN